MKKYSFEKLGVWQKSRLLAKLIYKLTNNFPTSEKFGLVSQLQRASISVSSNIADDTYRISFMEQARFIEMSYGSLMEVLNQLVLSRDLNFISNDEETELRILIDEIGNKLNKLRINQLDKHKQLNNINN